MIKMLSAVLLLCSWTGAAASAEGQSNTAAPATQGATVHVGGAAANCERLRPYDHAWFWHVIMPDGTNRQEGIWSDHLDLTTVNGRRVLRRVQGVTYLNGLSTSGVVLIDPATCAPISNEQHRLNGAVLKRTFDNGQMTTERTEPPAAMRTATIATSETPFDFLNGEDGPLLAAFPLRVGYSATMLAASDFPDPDGTTLVSFRVIRQETINAGALGRVRTFVVESPLPRGEGIQTFWISPNPPYFIRLIITYSDHRYTHDFENL